MKNYKVVLVVLATMVSVSVFAQSKKVKYELKQEKTIKTDAVSVEDAALVEQEVHAEYPGGNAALFKFMGENIKYPKYEEKQNIQGKVIAEFVVKKDGSISDVVILRTVEKSKNLDAEVLRVIAKMPKWTPATKGGIPIDSKMTLPVKFAL
jgi:protein TonB